MKIALLLMAVVVVIQSFVISRLNKDLEETAYSIAGLKLKYSKLSELSEKRYDQLTEANAKLALKLEEIPVEDIVEQARVEKEYFEGVQNIFNYSMADIAKLNKDGI